MNQLLDHPNIDEEAKEEFSELSKKDQDRVIKIFFGEKKTHDRMLKTAQNKRPFRRDEAIKFHSDQGDYYCETCDRYQWSCDDCDENIDYVPLVCNIGNTNYCQVCRCEKCQEGHEKHCK